MICVLPSSMRFVAHTDNEKWPCADIFQVGIYMLIDVNSPLAGESIDRSAPGTSYDSSYLNRTFAVVEAFKSYPNTLLFFAGNEVINDLPTSGTVPPYMRVSPFTFTLICGFFDVAGPCRVFISDI